MSRSFSLRGQLFHQRPRAEPGVAGPPALAISERLNLDTFSLKAHFGGPNLVVLQVAGADFGRARKYVVGRTMDNVHPGLGASDPFSVLIESKCDICGIKLPVADLLPDAMRTTKYRMRIPASKESALHA